MHQFNRSASLLVAHTGVTVPLQNTGLVIKDLRIEFTVTKTSAKEPNKATINVYNLSEPTRSKIKDTGQLVILNCGYLSGDGEQVCFIGNITSVNHDISPPYIITTIEARDGQKPLGSTKISLSKGSGISALQILREILNSLELSNNLKTLSVTDRQYANGFSFIGMSRVALTKVTEYLGLSWSVQNNEIRLVPFDGNDKTRVVKLTPQTGLVGSPKKLTGDVKKSIKESSTSKPGWMVNSLLIPQINPTGQIGLESREITPLTFFTVKSVTHRGDTHGTEWRSEIEVTES